MFRYEEQSANEETLIDFGNLSVEEAVKFIDLFKNDIILAYKFRLPFVIHGTEYQINCKLFQGDVKDVFGRFQAVESKK